MVIATGITAVAREHTALACTESDTEVIARRVHRHAHVLDDPTVHGRLVILVTGLQLGNKQVQTTHAGMSVTGEIQQAVGTHIGETLVALGIDLWAHILEGTVLVLEVDAPDVGAALASGHIAGEVEPLAIGADGGVGIVAERVGGNLKLLRRAPLGLAAGTGIDLDCCGPVLPHCTRQVHHRAVRRECCSALVMLGVQATVHDFGTGPNSLLVLLGEIDITFLGAGDLAAQFTC